MERVDKILAGTGRWSRREVKELIHKNVEAAKDKRRMRTTEIMGGPEDDEFAHDFDDETDCGSH